VNGNGKPTDLLPYVNNYGFLYIKQAPSLLGKVLQGYQVSMIVLDLIDGIISFMNHYYGVFSGD
jgi:hypothetical protein